LYITPEYRRFFHKFLTRKRTLSIDEKKAGFVAPLLKFEEKYILYFQGKLQEFSLALPDRLRNHYLLRKEFEYIRFDFRPGSDLAANIKKECDAAYQKVWGNN
jgi:hypothetical protein